MCSLLAGLRLGLIILQSLGGMQPPASSGGFAGLVVATTGDQRKFPRRASVRVQTPIERWEPIRAGRMTAWGIRLQNNGATPIAINSMSFTGEQSRVGSSGVSQTVTFDYQISPSPITDLSSGTYIALGRLDFTSPVTSPANVNVNGNDGANQSPPYPSARWGYRSHQALKSCFDGPIWMEPVTTRTWQLTICLFPTPPCRSRARGRWFFSSLVGWSFSGSGVVMLDRKVANAAGFTLVELLATVALSESWQRLSPGDCAKSFSAKSAGGMHWESPQIGSRNADYINERRRPVAHDRIGAIQQPAVVSAAGSLRGARMKKGADRPSRKAASSFFSARLTGHLRAGCHLRAQCSQRESRQAAIEQPSKKIWLITSTDSYSVNYSGLQRVNFSHNGKPTSCISTGTRNSLTKIHSRTSHPTRSTPNRRGEV